MDYRGKKWNWTIDTIQETVAVNKLSSPAIIIGEVVGTVRESRFYEELNQITILVYGKK
jgi:uroporphyrin-III C-methyltransferase